MKAGRQPIKVKILDHTAKPLHAVYFAARTCYSADSPQTMWRKKADVEKMRQLVLRTVEAGHHSVLEHAEFVFAISGISRACSHQLVRHRIASFSQQSQRYVKSAAPQYVVPPTILRNPGLARQYRLAIRQLYGLYQAFTGAGIPPEDARFLLPNAASTNLVMTMNLRELIHICSIRLCTNAQWEIRGLANEIKKAVCRLNPFLGALLVIKCDTLGYCPEFKSCGRHPKKQTVLSRV